MRHMLGNTSPNYFERTRRWLMMHPDGGWGSETLSLTAFAAPTLKSVTKKSKVTSCEVSFTPSQDLHGYDNPWPAGGGKNKLPITATTTTVSGVTFTINDDGSISTSNTATDAIVFLVATDLAIDGTNMALNGCPSGGSDSTYYMTARLNGAWSSQHDTGSGLALYGTIDRVAIVVSSGTNMNGLTFYPMIRSTTETNTFAPYSNICPISGWQGAAVTVDPLYGGNIEWNQLADSVSESGDHIAESWASTITRDNGKLVVATTRDYTEMGFNYINSTPTFVQGHKYLVSMNVKNSTFEITSIIYSLMSGWSNVGQISLDYTGTGVYSGIITANGDGTSGSIQRFGVRAFGNSVTGDSITVYDGTLIDLTKCFGEGNEPTIEQFRALFPLDYYAYNAGEVTNVSAVSGLPYSKTVVTFGVQGKNLLNTSASTAGYRTDNTGEITPSANYSVSDYIPCENGQAYYFSHVVGSQNGYSIWVYDTNKTALNYHNIYGGSDVSNTWTVDVTGAVWMRISYATANASSVMVEKGSSASQYEPYRDYILGGTAEIVAGTGSEQYAEVDMGSLSYTKNTQLAGWDRFSIRLSDMPGVSGSVAAPVICEQFTSVPIIQANSNPKSNYVAGFDYDLYFYTVAGTYATADDFATAMQGVKFVYDPATPTAYTFPPASNELLLQKGDNNAWAEMTTGD